MLDLLKECKGAKTIAITGHIRPDGDCVGSAMALYLFLKKKMTDAKIRVFLEHPSDKFAVIKDFNEIDNEKPEEDYAPDVYIMVDVDKERVGISEGLFEKAKKTINIDHHISNKNGCGDVNYVVPEAGSAAEVCYEVIGKENIDYDIAVAIYIGMIHDTGIFQYSSTSPNTLRIAADLISYGFDFTSIIENTFYEKTYVQTQILGRALLESILFLDGECVVSHMDQKTMSFYGATTNDMEGIVSQLRNIKGVECSVFMYELAPQQYKVSLRSSKYVDCRKIAEVFGGGGHIRAAGCNLNGTFYDVVNNLSKYIEIQVKEHRKER